MKKFGFIKPEYMTLLDVKLSFVKNKEDENKIINEE